jgi:hypothetical protein
MQKISSKKKEFQLYTAQNVKEYFAEHLKQCTCEQVFLKQLSAGGGGGTAHCSA